MPARHLVASLLPAVLPFWLGAQAAVDSSPDFPHDRGVVVRTVRVPAGLLDGPDGAALDRDGRLLVANWGGGKGTTVVRLDPRGRAPATTMAGFVAPDGVAVRADATILVSNFGDGTVVSVARDGSRRVLARGLGHPSGLALDGDTVLVADFGEWNGTVVRRVLPDGRVDTVATGLEAPIGIARDGRGALVASSFGSGVLRVVERDGSSRVLAQLPNAPRAMLQYVALDDDGCVLVPSYGHQRIYRVTRAGAVSIVAGTGARGARDGDGRSATFAGPNSIVRDRDGSFLITEYDGRRVRRIVVGRHGR